MTEETRVLQKYKLSYALRGVLQSACIFFVNLMVLVAREFQREADPDIRTNIDVEYTIIGVTLLGFVSLSLVLGINGWRKGKRIAIARSEHDDDEAPPAIDLSNLWILLLFTIILVYLSLQLI